MKKILGFVMILITVITVAGCGGKDMVVLCQDLVQVKMRFSSS